MLFVRYKMCNKEFIKLTEHFYGDILFKELLECGILEKEDDNSEENKNENEDKNKGKSVEVKKYIKKIGKMIDNAENKKELISAFIEDNELIELKKVFLYLLLDRKKYYEVNVTDILDEILKEGKLCHKINDSQTSKIKLQVDDKQINLKKLESIATDKKECQDIINDSKERFKGEVFVYQWDSEKKGDNEDNESIKWDYLFLDKRLLLNKNSQKIKDGKYKDFLEEVLSSRYKVPKLFAIIRENMRFFQDKKELEKKIATKELLDKIQLALIFKFLNPDNQNASSNKEDSSDNDTGHLSYYEILQNINDHANHQCSKVKVELGEKFISFVYQEKTRKIMLKGESKEVKGMRGFDVFALTTLANSVSRSVSDATGEKGTGFKSVYKDFEKIEVESYGFSFMLDKTVSIDDDKLDELDYNSKDRKLLLNDKPVQNYGKLFDELSLKDNEKKYNRGDKHYPLLRYGKQEESTDNTKFTYYFKEDSDSMEWLENFFSPEASLFLEIKWEGNTAIKYIKELEKWEKLKETNLKNVDELLKKESSEKNYAQILFMDLLDESKDGKFYCGLPIDNVKTEIPVHINLPLLKLDDNRKDIKKDDLTNQDLFSALFDGEEESKYVQVLNVFASEVWASKYNKDNEVQKFYKYIPKFYYRSIDEKWEKDKPQKYHNQFQYCKVFLCYEYDKEKKIWEEKLSNLEDAYILKSKLYEKINSFLKTENRKKDFLKILSDNDINKILLSYGKEDIGDISKIVNVSKIVKVNEVQTTISDVALGYSFIRASYNGDNIVDDNITEIASYIESEKLIPYLYLLSYHRKHKEEDLVKLSFSEDKIIKDIESLVSCIELGKKYAYFSEKIEENIRKKIFVKKQYCDFSSIHEDLEAEVNKNRNNKITLDTLIKELKVKTDEEIFIDKDLFNEVKNSLEVKELGELFRKIVTSEIEIGDEIFGQIPFELRDGEWKTLESLEKSSEGIFLYEKGGKDLLVTLESTDVRYKKNIAVKDNEVFFEILSSNIDSKYQSLLEKKMIVILGQNEYKSDIESIAEIGTDLADYLYFDLLCLRYSKCRSQELKYFAKENYFFTQSIGQYNDFFLDEGIYLTVECDYKWIKPFNNEEKIERHRKRMLEEDFENHYKGDKDKFQLKKFFYVLKEKYGNEEIGEEPDVNKIYIYNGKRKEINGRKLNFSYLFLKDNKDEDIILLSDEGQLKKVFQDFGVIYRDLEKISAVPILLNQKSKISLERRITPDVCNNEKLVYKNENAKSFEKEIIKLRWMADYYYQEKIYPGYGQFCPICNSRIITQLSGVRLPWIVVTLEEKEDNFKIRLCSCMNCKEAIDKSIDVQILKICSGSNGSNYEKFKDKYDFGAYLLKMNTKLALTMDLLLKTGDTITETFEWHPNFIHRIDMYNASMKEKRGKDGQ